MSGVCISVTLQVERMVLTAKSAGMEFHKIAGGPGELDKESIRLSVSDMVAYVVDSDRYATRIDEDACM